MTHWLLHDHAIPLSSVTVEVFVDLKLHGVYYEGKRYRYNQGSKAYLVSDLESFVERHHYDPAASHQEKVPVPKNHVGDLSVLSSGLGGRFLVFSTTVSSNVPPIIRGNYDRFEVWMP